MRVKFLIVFIFLTGCSTNEYVCRQECPFSEHDCFDGQGKEIFDYEGQCYQTECTFRCTEKDPEKLQGEKK